MFNILLIIGLSGIVLGFTCLVNMAWNMWLDGILNDIECNRYMVMIESRNLIRELGKYEYS